MTACANCSTREAVYRVAPKGASRADYCEVDLPPHLAERAETGEFNLLSPVPTTFWVQRGDDWVEIMKLGNNKWVAAAEEREIKPGHSHHGPLEDSALLADQPVTKKDKIHELPVGTSPVGHTH